VPRQPIANNPEEEDVERDSVGTSSVEDEEAISH
jgi:hypothetical protein